ncbi:GRP family sugar transporter [Macrococcoides goetzii]|uniref:Glucose transporter n=1 Tax=Macrococcoides bohemicum TaxID=1903056 RepID=A0A328A799_9STAP|nr:MULTISPECIES: GRP family sugar transporter [Macrococcus]MCG7418994.1 GRP family sugar transporter [Macrococcus epidermidis]MCH4985579.1 EamA family transporter [Macrococcus sp. PK]QRN48896.1 EamA family transporter [Macrococcus bohemicus]QYA45028.1 GRP family sugar transporter [Macrococcus bohemicus]RAK49724.1 glucose transporter [Macrococcus bohemicus]
MDLLIALLPALLWGSVVLINVKVGGSPYEQIMGTVLGAFIIGTITYFIVQPELNLKILAVGIISGAFWALGQGNQLKSVELIGVSKTMPISTGLQLVSTTLISVLFFNEWTTTKAVVLGIAALLFLVIGVILTSLKGDNEDGGNNNYKKALPILIISTIGYVTYVVIGQFFGVEGWDALFPQAIGMVIGGILLSFKHQPKKKNVLKNIIPGVVWALGNMALFYSQPKVGVATSFSFSQMLVVVSTLGGIFILKEKKTKKQYIGIAIGIILIIVAAFLLGLAKK